MPVLNNNKLLILIVSILIIVLTIFGVYSYNNQNKNNKEIIVVTDFSNYSIMDQINDGSYNIKFISEGQDAHNFEPTANNIIDIKNAKYIIQNGSIDSWMDEIIKNENIDNDKVIKLLENKDINPHIWLSPNRILSNIIQIGDKTGLNTTKISKDYIDLDVEYSDLDSCKYSTTFATNYAFDYVAIDYGFNINSVPEEGNVSDIAEIIEGLKKSENKFIIQGEDEELAETISTETNSEIVKINILENVTSKSDKTHAQLLRDNLELFKKILSC